MRSPRERLTVTRESKEKKKKTHIKRKNKQKMKRIEGKIRQKKDFEDNIIARHK